MSKLILALSIAANLVAGIWCFSGWDREMNAPRGIVVADFDQLKADGKNLPKPPASKAESDKLQMDDVAAPYRQLPSRGMPAHLVRAMTRYSIHEHYAKLRMELRKNQPTSPFWDRDFGAMAILGADPASREELAKLDQAERDAIKGAVGVAATDYSIDEMASVRKFIGDVAPEVAAEFCVTFLERMHQLYPEMVTADSETRRAMAERLRSDVREKMARLLTPEQLNEFDYRNDEDLRRTLRTFRPTEDEFQALAKIYRQNRGATEDSTEPAAQVTAQAALEAKIAPALGAERFEDFKLATNPRLEPYNTFVARLGLPISTGAKLVSIEDSFKQSVARLNAQKIPSSQMPIRYAELVQTADASVTRLLGESGAGMYKQGLGYWLTVSPWQGSLKK